MLRLLWRSLFNSIKIRSGNVFIAYISLLSISLSILSLFSPFFPFSYLYFSQSIIKLFHYRVRGCSEQSKWKMVRGKIHSRNTLWRTKISPRRPFRIKRHKGQRISYLTKKGWKRQFNSVLILFTSFTKYHLFLVCRGAALEKSTRWWKIILMTSWYRRVAPLS